MQNNTKYALASTSGFSDLKVYNSAASLYNISIANVYFSSYPDSSKNGRFILYFGTPGVIDFKVYTSNGISIGDYPLQSVTANNPVYVTFESPKNNNSITLSYSTTSTSIVLNKLLIEFF
jgi:hypothetical protein